MTISGSCILDASASNVTTVESRLLVGSYGVKISAGGQGHARRIAVALDSAVCHGWEVTRKAECACGRVRVTVEGEPLVVAACHCQFCQRRTGSIVQVGAAFDDEGVSIAGETSVFNGLEVNGVGTSNGDEVSYHFCPTCGSTVFWRFKGRPTVAVGVGSFADANFPAPTVELHAPLRHHWLRPVEGAEQYEEFRPR